MKIRCGIFTFLFFLSMQAQAEPLRVLVAGSLELSLDMPAGASVPLGYNGSAVLLLGVGARFFKGIELELSAPRAWLANQGSLAAAAYADLDKIPPLGIADINGRRILFEPIPNKLQTFYQIPIRSGHGLRTTPYVTVLSSVISPASYPVLFRILPVVKGLSDELENMVFQLSAKPILGDEGAVKISFRYPEQLHGKSFTVLIDDKVIDRPTEERLLKEGEHHLVILSDDYRNENRRFLVERAKTLDLAIELQDPTPLIIFEAPENARIFLDNAPVRSSLEPIPVEPGTHEVRFLVGDYTTIQVLNVQRGKTYRVALTVDVNVSESE
ncbi:hypothetical protein AGMMS49587_02310 [Spirochaetia bacterium]|nr:hypothetical protein AGMMS49587_02310 [Spirochaetia bacterium]